LMFYNMGELKKWESNNSILDLEIARKYLINFEQYPLSLDLALPIFSWGVLFRDGAMIKLLNQLDKDALQDSERFVERDENRYEVIKSTYLKGHYIYKGDQIRLEISKMDELRRACELLNKYLIDERRSVVFYHLDTMVIKQFPYEQIQTLPKILSSS